MKRLLFIAITLSVGLTAQGQDTERTRHHLVPSEHLPDERTIAVHLPASYASYPAARFPVLYLLDGDVNLDHAAPVVDFLAENGKIPEMIIVALHTGSTRSRDFIPALDGDPSSGAGGEAFLAHLHDELIPWIQARYRTAPLRLISGHSLGGLFVTWAMTKDDDLANGYLVQSPYLMQAVGEQVLEQVRTVPAGTDVYYYATLGTEPDLTERFDLLEAELQAIQSDTFRWDMEHAPEENHMSTRLVGLYVGLTSFFEGGWAIASETLQREGMDGLVSHIETLSNRYDYPVLFSEQPFQELTQRYMSQGEMASARRAAALYTSHHDPSVVAHFLHGVTLASTGERSDGLAEINRAIALYEKAPDPRLAPVYAQLKQLKQQLGG